MAPILLWPTSLFDPTWPFLFMSSSFLPAIHLPPRVRPSHEAKFVPNKNSWKKKHLANFISTFDEIVFVAIYTKFQSENENYFERKKNGKPCGRETRKATRSVQKGSQKGHRAKTRPRSRLNPHWLLRRRRVRKMISRAKLCGMKNTLKKQLHIFIHISRQRPVNRWGRGEGEDGFLSVAHTDNVRRGSARAGGRR